MCVHVCVHACVCAHTHIQREVGEIYLKELAHVIVRVGKFKKNLRGRPAGWRPGVELMCCYESEGLKQKSFLL